MAIPLKNIRDLLLPGLNTVTTRYTSSQWSDVFMDEAQEPAPPLVAHPDPTFTLSELEQAQDLIEKLKK